VSARLIGLLAIAMFINYADRGSLSVAAPLLKDQLHIDNGQMGLLLSGFFWTYALAQPVAGAIAQRFDVRWVLAGGLTLWACATMLCGLAGSFAALMGLRFLLGLGESVIFPANARLLAERAANHERGHANGVISMGMCLGPAAGTLAGGLILAHFGWRAVFLSLGAVSLLWLAPWLTTAMPTASAQPPPQPGLSVPKPPGFADILRQRSLWGASIGQFCYSYQPYLLLTWLPLFLVKSQHYSLTAMAWVGAGVPVCQALGAGLSGALSDRLIRRGLSTTLVRKGFMLTGMACSGLGIAAVALAPRAGLVPCLFFSGFFSGTMSPMVFTIGQTLAGPRAGGRWMGVQNLVGNLAGISAPIVTGLVVQATGSFKFAFLVAASLSVVGLFCWGFVVEQVEPVAWGRTRTLSDGLPGAEPSPAG
jgi:MFS family permease